MANPNVRTSYEKVLLARDQKRPTIMDYLDGLFTDFLELKGDRLGGEDSSILGGIAFFHGKPVTVIGHRKGRNLEENVAYNFGMAGPRGYRKAKRLMEQAEKFRRPIITFIDTPGAHPGIEAEENGQSMAIAECLAAMSKLTVPVIAIVTGEGSSGGALALAVANQVWMLENAVYSILSPEGFASIIWKDAKRSQEACEIMKITSQDLLAYGLIDGILPEAPNGIQQAPARTMKAIDRMLVTQLNRMSKIKGSALREQRYRRFRNIEGQYCPD